MGGGRWKPPVGGRSGSRDGCVGGSGVTDSGLGGSGAGGSGAWSGFGAASAGTKSTGGREGRGVAARVKVGSTGAGAGS